MNALVAQARAIASTTRTVHGLLDKPALNIVAEETVAELLEELADALEGADDECVHADPCPITETPEEPMNDIEMDIVVVQAALPPRGAILSGMPKYLRLNLERIDAIHEAMERIQYRLHRLDAFEMAVEASPDALAHLPHITAGPVCWCDLRVEEVPPS